ncbi:uncharacterized protein ARMOST_08614 [Armillaria ostoyae]|uniref:Uncharacterized protein n=1 Tax=Armillaria ostoyae TaxID=47428 RepID=A0A284R935_ARMOS|nr:uncharacterized protein ARMOST_08614 [Armillaria ostoyae]
MFPIIVIVPTSTDLNVKEYKALTVERVAIEGRYNDVVDKHKEWKANKAKEAQAEALRLKEAAWAAKLEVLKQQELEKEQLWLEAEEKEWLQLEAKEK